MQSQKLKVAYTRVVLFTLVHTRPIMVSTHLDLHVLGL